MDSLKKGLMSRFLSKESQILAILREADKEALAYVAKNYGIGDAERLHLAQSHWSC